MSARSNRKLAFALHYPASMQTIQTLDALVTVTGGMPLKGDVGQSIPTATTRFEYLRQNPAARFGPPPYKPMPARHS